MQWLIVNATTPETILRPFGHFDGAIRGRARLVLVPHDEKVDQLQEVLTQADLLTHAAYFSARHLALQHLYGLAQQDGIPTPAYQIAMVRGYYPFDDDGFRTEADALQTARMLSEADDRAMAIWDLQRVPPVVMALAYEGRVYRLDTTPALVASPHPPPTGGIWGDLQAGIATQDRNKGG